MDHRNRNMESIMSDETLTFYFSFNGADLGADLSVEYVPTPDDYRGGMRGDDVKAYAIAKLWKDEPSNGDPEVSDYDELAILDHINYKLNDEIYDQYCRSHSDNYN